MARMRKRENPPEDIPMAPMIDMVFLLLVFFMVVSTVAQAEKFKEVELPKSEESEVPEDASGRGTITVDAEGNIYHGAARIDLAEMKTRIRSALADNPELTIYVRADQAANYGAIKKVLKGCAEAGAFEVIYATNQKR